MGIVTLGLVESGALPGGDCDDEDALRHPDTEEICDGVINGCDATLPDDEIDDDADGFVDCTVVDSGWQGDASVQGGDDCDDDDPILFPTQEWYGDSDADGFGAGDDVQVSCAGPEGYVLNSDDCNDDDATIYPEANEICDGIVNACDGTLPEDEIDNDGDGYVECSIDSEDGMVMQGSLAVMTALTWMDLFLFPKRTIWMRIRMGLERQMYRCRLVSNPMDTYSIARIVTTTMQRST